jgi:diguanylate cyclase (GGDEF)-like protein
MSTTNHPLTLLIISDNEHAIAMFSDLFSDLFNLEFAQDGKIALQSILQKDIDLVLSAVNTPVISGQELCIFVKDSQLTTHIPVVFFSDKPSVDEEEQCLAMGAIDYIAQNARPSVLRLRVNNVMAMVSQHKKLAVVSCTDGLTGLANRMQLDIVLNKEWYSAVRGGHAIAALIIDIDHFKLFNDEFGHVKGDECLKAVANMIDSAKRRERDFAARYGGEEFLLLLPFTDMVGAELVAKTLLNTVRQANLQPASGASHPMVTISIGIAGFPSTHRDDVMSSPTELINGADNNLFKAKLAGRNQYQSSR